MRSHDGPPLATIHHLAEAYAHPHLAPIAGSPPSGADHPGFVFPYRKTTLARHESVAFPPRGSRAQVSSQFGKALLLLRVWLDQLRFIHQRAQGGPVRLLAGEALELDERALSQR